MQAAMTTSLSRLIPDTLRAGLNASALTVHRAAEAVLEGWRRLSAAREATRALELMSDRDLRDIGIFRHQVPDIARRGRGHERLY